MENGPFTTPEFARYARSVVPFCHVMTKLADDPQAGLRERLCGKGAGTPSVAYLDPTGYVLAVHRGELDVAAFQRFTERAQTLFRLLSLEDPDVQERVQILEAQLELFSVTVEVAQARRDELVAEDPSLARRLDGAITDQRVLLLWIERQPQTAKARVSLGEAYWKLFEAGGRPSSQRALEAFYVLIFDHAEAAKQPARFEAALDALAEQVQGQAGMDGYLRQQRQRLERLR